MESQQRGGAGEGTTVGALHAPPQIFRIELHTAGTLQIARKIPVDGEGRRDVTKPEIFESAVDLRNPRNPQAGLHIVFSIPAKTIGEAFANWQTARQSAERHVTEQLRSKIVLASAAQPVR